MNTVSAVVSNSVSSRATGRPSPRRIAASISPARKRASPTVIDPALPMTFQMRSPAYWEWMKKRFLPEGSTRTPKPLSLPSRTSRAVLRGLSILTRASVRDFFRMVLSPDFEDSRVGGHCVSHRPPEEFWRKTGAKPIGRGSGISQGTGGAGAKRTAERRHRRHGPCRPAGAPAPGAGPRPAHRAGAEQPAVQCRPALSRVLAHPGRCGARRHACRSLGLGRGPGDTRGAAAVPVLQVRRPRRRGRRARAAGVRPGARHLICKGLVEAHGGRIRA